MSITTINNDDFMHIGVVCDARQMPQADVFLQDVAMQMWTLADIVSFRKPPSVEPDDALLSWNYHVDAENYELDYMLAYMHNHELARQFMQEQQTDGLAHWGDTERFPIMPLNPLASMPHPSLSLSLAKRMILPQKPERQYRDNGDAYDRRFAAPSKL